MDLLTCYIDEYINFCKYRKHLDRKTLKAYSIDLKQYQIFLAGNHDFLSRVMVDSFITNLHTQYQPKTVKRKIASLKAFFRYLTYQEILEQNPFDKLDIRFREAKLLPKTIPFHSIQTLLSTVYAQSKLAKTKYESRCCIKDIAVLELLFATGMRISELCALKSSDIDLENKSVLVYGKGAKERVIQIGNSDVLSALSLYQKTFQGDITACGYFFVNRDRRKLSDQSVRFMIKKYTKLAGITQHITPHMFRHPYVKSTTKKYEDFFQLLKAS